MEALYERVDCLQGKLKPLLAEAQVIELALAAALPKAPLSGIAGGIATTLAMTIGRTAGLLGELDRACEEREAQLQTFITEWVAEISLSPLVAYCTAFEDEAMRSGSIQRRNDAAGARAAAVVIETYKRLPEELKPVYCAKETPDQHRAGLVRRGIDVKALEAEG